MELIKVNLALVVLASTILCLVPAEGFKRVCYYSNWSQHRPGVGKFFPTDIDPTLCTHLVFSFAILNSNYELAPIEGNDVSVLYKQFNALKVGTDIKTLLAVGGWRAGSQRFSDMVTTRYLREKFARQAVEFIVEHGFDGLDLDWEYPANRYGSRSSDKENFIILLEDIRKAMIIQGQCHLLLTAAVSAGKRTIDSAYGIPGMVEYLDFINLMSYDFHGGWEPFTGHNSPLYSRSSEHNTGQERLNVDWAANYWVYLGTPPEKLIIGLPTNGRHFTLTDPTNHHKMGAPASGNGPTAYYTNEPGYLAYFEVCEMMDSQDARRYWHAEHQVPYLILGNQWVGYDDKLSFMIKLQYIMDNSFGGAMIWNVDLDDFTGEFCGEKYPLMNVMKDALGDYTSESKPECPVTDGTTPDTPATSPQGEISCEGKLEGTYIADPVNCSVFYRCVHGVKQMYECGNGYLWNRILNYCDYATNIDCWSANNVHSTATPTTQSSTTTSTTQSSPTTSTTQSSTTTPTTQSSPTTSTTQSSPTTSTTQSSTTTSTTQSSPTTSTTQSSPTTSTIQSSPTTSTTQSSPTTSTTQSSPTTSTTQSSTATSATTQSSNIDFCVGKSPGLYPNEEDCSQYYRCGNSGSTEVFTCPYTTYFSTERGYCDWIANVECGYQPEPVVDEECVDGLYPDRDSCHKYIQCSHGDKLPKTCWPLVFNPVLSYCDWPENVDCSDSP